MLDFLPLIIIDWHICIVSGALRKLGITFVETFFRSIGSVSPIIIQRDMRQIIQLALETSKSYLPSLFKCHLPVTCR